jgi:hypothetical protein
MRSEINDTFRRLYRKLPAAARRDALKSYHLWKSDPYHPSLHFKEIKISKSKSLWSVRTELGYRVLGKRPEPDKVIWGWIGTHAQYDYLIAARRARKSGLTD